MGKSDVQTEIKPAGAELVINPEFEKSMDAAVSTDDIRAIIEQEAAKQNIVIPRDDKGRFTSPYPVAAKAAEAPKVVDEKFAYEDTFTIGGKDYKFEGDSPADINRQVKAAILAHENASKPAEVKADPVKDAQVKEDERLAMQLDVMSGKMGMDEYIVKSGAVDRYLQSKGMKTDELKELVDEKKTRKEEDSWKTATDAFLRLEGNDWPGGDQNLKTMGYKLAELNLNDKPSVESLQRAYESMKADNMVFPVEPTVDKKETASEAPKAQPTKKQPASSSSFGVGGGDSRKERQAATSASGVPNITDDMSPRDIMEAFKAAALANGQHPDEIMRESQRR